MDTFFGAGFATGFENGSSRKLVASEENADDVALEFFSSFATPSKSDDPRPGFEDPNTSSPSNIDMDIFDEGNKAITLGDLSFRKGFFDLFGHKVGTVQHINF